MQWLAQYTSLIEKALSEKKFEKDPKALYEPLDYFLSIGGKRVRPVLTLLAAELFGSKAGSVLPQAIGIELFHNFTLIHDDIMDEAPLRRNKRTVHQKYGLNAGILSGDALLIIAYQEICKTDPDKLPQLIELFNRTAIEVCEGQQKDMDFEKRLDVSVSEYIEMIRLKTSVLLGCALEFGALLANADKKDAELLYAFGENIGIAFQIRDDILDLYADPETFGKQIGGDIIANKKTILYLTALGSSTREQLDVFKNLHEEEDAELKLERTREIFDRLNVKEQCTERMHFYYTKAMDALEQVAVPVENKSKLRELAFYLIERSI